MSSQPTGTGNADSADLLYNANERGEFPERTKYLDGTDGVLMLETCKRFNCTLLMIEGE